MLLFCSHFDINTENYNFLKAELRKRWTYSSLCGWFHDLLGVFLMKTLYRQSLCYLDL